MTRALRTDRGSSGRALTSGLLLFACLAAYGCKSEEPDKYAPPRRDAGGGDSGQDASLEGDADVDAGSGEGGSSGGGGADGGGGGAGSGGGSGEAGDGGSATDAGDAGPEVEPCELTDEQNTFSADVPSGDDARAAVTTGTTGFGVAYQGESEDCGLAGVLRVLPVQAAGAFPSPQIALGDCSAIRDLTILHVAEGWRVVWVDNAAGSYELQSTVLKENMSEPVGALRTRLTTNDLVERRPALANVGGVPLLAYIAEGGEAPSITTRLTISRFAEGAEPHDVIPESAARKPSSIALTQIGNEHAVLAWADDEAKPGVWIQRTDLMGVASGEPILLTDAVSAGTTVDLAARDMNQGGAALYSVAIGGVNREVRFRRLSATGEPLADEIKIIGQPLQGTDASFARLGGGYAVAYRALPSGPISVPEIRLTFVSKEGFVMRDRAGELISYKIADTTASAGRVTLRVSTDGQMLVGYIDGTGSDRKLKLIRKRLDCSL